MRTFMKVATAVVGLGLIVMKAFGMLDLSWFWTVVVCCLLF